MSSFANSPGSRSSLQAMLGRRATYYAWNHSEQSCIAAQNIDWCMGEYISLQKQSVAGTWLQTAGSAA